jgi:hypothetical protein
VASGVKVEENKLPPERGERLETVWDRNSGESALRMVDKKGAHHPFPRLGAFEVYFQHHLVFSKLHTSLWPNTELLSEKL